MLNASLRQLVTILRAAEVDLRESMNDAYSLLSMPATAEKVKRFVVPREQRLQWKGSDELLDQIATIVRERKVGPAFTDWPFENFWGNPSEPQHSKLLAYFIDPKEPHGCGRFLLEQLLGVLELHRPVDEPFLVDEYCRVDVEYAHIDLLITRKPPHGSKGRYAIIIENKINGALDRHRQLENYYKTMRKVGFSDNEVYPVYLSLTHKKPSDDSRGDITEERIKKANFKEHIAPWLDRAKQDVQVSMEMRENLTHYSNLLKYLLRKERVQTMRKEILENLRKADSEGTLPDWEQVVDLKNAADELMDCYRRLLRSKLLSDLQLTLQKDQHLDTGFVSVVDKIAKDEPSPFVQPLAQELWLVCRSGDPVRVAVGIGIAEERDERVDIYIGYQRNPDKSIEEAKQKRLENFLKSNPDLPHSENDDIWLGYDFYVINEVAEVYPNRMADLAAKVVKVHSDIKEALRRYSKGLKSAPKELLER